METSVAMILDDAKDIKANGWLSSARKKAAARFHDSGLPKQRDEYWKHTDPGQFQIGSVGDGPATEIPAGVPDMCPRATFRNGRVVELPQPGPNVPELATLGDAAADESHWGAGLYGSLEARAQKTVVRGFAALNTRDAEHGILATTAPNTKQSLQIHYCSESNGSKGILHHLIRVAPGSDLCLLEFGSVAGQANVVFEVDVMDGARFSHIRLQNKRKGRRSIEQVFARVGCGSSFNLFTLSADHKVVRNDCVVELLGEGGEAHVSGAVVGASGSHHDDTVLVVHDAANCRSRQVFKKVLSDGSVGVFQGKILVRNKAQKTDGYQISKAMLVGETGQFLAKPELEIYADDVVCSHGSTSGNADADSLFYLRARGIPERESLNLLALAFLAETLEEISDKSEMEMIRQLMIEHLAEQGNVGRD
ncbi:MAG: SufD family Fe-S cluster assembly protein [Rhodobacteraceae bacterium]|nr:SufD family Fe-S cluster assembly protein [Paracoccaceae bacterium]